MTYNSEFPDSNNLEIFVDTDFVKIEIAGSYTFYFFFLVNVL